MQGRPKVNIIGVNLDTIESVDISLSHCKQYATANVTILSRD